MLDHRGRYIAQDDQIGLTQLAPTESERNPVAPIAQTTQNALSDIEYAGRRINFAATRRNYPQIAKYPPQSPDDARQVGWINPFQFRRCRMSSRSFLVRSFTAALGRSLLQLQGKVATGNAENRFMIGLSDSHPLEKLPRRPQKCGYGRRLFFFIARASKDSPLAARSEPSQALRNMAHNPSTPILCWKVVIS